MNNSCFSYVSLPKNQFLVKFQHHSKQSDELISSILTRSLKTYHVPQKLACSKIQSRTFSILVKVVQSTHNKENDSPASSVTNFHKLPETDKGCPIRVLKVLFSRRVTASDFEQKRRINSKFADRNQSVKYKLIIVETSKNKGPSKFPNPKFLSPSFYAKSVAGYCRNLESKFEKIMKNEVGSFLTPFLNSDLKACKQSPFSKSIYHAGNLYQSNKNLALVGLSYNFV